MTKRITTAAHSGVPAMNQLAFATMASFGAYLLMMDFAYADLGSTLCNFVGIANGQVGSAFATLGVIIIGAGACIGKVSWGMAVTVIVGISVMFNAGYFIEKAGGTACGGF